MVSGSDSRIKKSKKTSMVFAKDPKQAVMALVAIILFVVAGVHAMMQNNPSSAPSPQPQTTQPVAQNVDPNAPSPTGQAQIAPDGAQAPGQTPGSTQNMAQDANNIYSQASNMQGNQPGASSQVPTTPQGGGVEILPKRGGKMVDVVVGSSGRTNPFLPPSEVSVAHGAGKKVSFPHLTAPPQSLNTGSEAGRVMTTQISGILYDKYSPSAIINIEGTDYLVKKGDVVNHYRILGISKTQVMVQLGKNIYKAGVGQLLSPADTGMNTIANLNRKFGGNNVSVRGKRK